MGVTGPKGFEPPPESCGNSPLSPTRGTENGTLALGNTTNPLVLELLAIWADLPPNRQLELLAIARVMLASPTLVVTHWLLAGNRVPAYPSPVECLQAAAAAGRRPRPQGVPTHSEAVSGP